MLHRQRVCEKRKSLNDFLSVCSKKIKVSVTSCYQDPSHRVKLQYFSLAKFILGLAMSLMAPNDHDLLMNDLPSNQNTLEPTLVLDGNFRQVMLGMSEAYTNAESWQSK